MTAGVFAVSVYGVTEIKVEFDPFLLLPEGSYLRLFRELSEKFFPSSGGAVATIYTGEFRYELGDFEKLDTMMEDLVNLSANEPFVACACSNRHTYKLLLKGLDLSGRVSVSGAWSWWLAFKHFLALQLGVEDWRGAVRDGSIRVYLSDFLHHADGATQMENFKFDGDLSCGEPAPFIKATQKLSLYFFTYLIELPLNLRAVSETRRGRLLAVRRPRRARSSPGGRREHN